MAREPKIEHGKRTTYVRGCRCGLCKQANTEYGKKLKARRRRGDAIQPPLASVTNIAQPKGGQNRELDLGDVPLPSVPNQPAAQRTELDLGPVEKAVVREMASLSASAKHPGLVESVRAMAKILDTPEFVTTQPSAHRQMTAGLDKLWSKSVGRQGELASVAAMIRRPGAPERAVGDDD